jgi:hypothetical protein
LILATQTGVTLPSTRIKSKKRWDTMDLLKILVPALLVMALVALKTHVAFGADINGVNITPPQGWEVSGGTAGSSLVMQEPAPNMAEVEKAAAKTGKPQTTFRRNITVAAIQKPAPIDEQRAVELKTELEKRFGQSSMAREYQVTEHKFFNYRGKNDGLVVYASMVLNDVPVMQMHILVSGAEQQYLLTYTDLAESITNPNNPAFEAAWNSMVSIDVKGSAPQRVDYEKIGMAAGGGVGLLFIGFLLVRLLRRSNPLREAEAMLAEEQSASGKSSDFLLGSNLATLPVAWKLDGSGDAGSEDMSFDMPVSSISSF